MATPSTIYLSTYNATYHGTQPFLPPIKYYQSPCIALAGELPMLQPRQFPLEPEGPCRSCETGRIPGLNLGNKDLSTLRFLDPKPIVQTLPPREISYRLPKQRKKSAKKATKKDQRDVRVRVKTPKPIPRPVYRELERKPEVLNLVSEAKVTDEVVDALVDSLTWTSTTGEAAEEAALPAPKVDPPNTTLEENSDIVKFKNRPKRYESRAHDWQKQAFMWERVQTRPPLLYSYEEHERTTGKNKLLQKRKSAKPKHVSKNTLELIRTNQLASTYVRQCPGYAGYVPRSPVEGTNIKLPDPPGMVTTAKSSYREFPSDNYTILEYAHKGPLSRNVTLTYPYNPYNKVEKKKISLN